MEVVKLKEIGATQMVMKVRVWCAQCGRPYVVHARHGFSTSEPTLNNEDTELRIPVEYPEDEPVAPEPEVLH